MDNCIFCKIANDESAKVMDEKNFVIIKDIAPQAKLHYLVIPKRHFDDVTDIAVNAPSILSEMLEYVAKNVEFLGLSDGFRIVTNIGKNGCQSVKHLHLHILGGEKLSDKMA